MAPADALLNALRVPREVVVDYEIAKLEVHPFSGRFGRDHDLGSVAEFIDECGPHIRRGRTGDDSKGGILGLPLLIDRLGTWIAVRSIEEEDFPRIAFHAQYLGKVFLRPPGLGEDKCFLGRSDFGGFLKTLCKCRFQRFALGVELDRFRETLIRLQFFEFLGNGKPGCRHFGGIDWIVVFLGFLVENLCRVGDVEANDIGDRSAAFNSASAAMRPSKRAIMVWSVDASANSRLCCQSEDVNGRHSNCIDRLQNVQPS